MVLFKEILPQKVLFKIHPLTPDLLDLISHGLANLMKRDESWEKELKLRQNNCDMFQALESKTRINSLISQKNKKKKKRIQYN